MFLVLFLKYPEKLSGLPKCSFLSILTESRCSGTAMNVDARLELDCQLVQDARKSTIVVRHVNSKHGMLDTRKNVSGLEVCLHFLCLITLSL